MEMKPEIVPVMKMQSKLTMLAWISLQKTAYELGDLTPDEVEFIDGMVEVAKKYNENIDEVIDNMLQGFLDHPEEMVAMQSQISRGIDFMNEK